MLPAYLKEAEFKYNEYRKMEYDADDPCSPFLFQVPGLVSYKPLYNEVTDEMAKDEHIVKLFSTKHSPDLKAFSGHEKLKSDLNFKDYMPYGEPLLHSLHVDHVKAKTWQQPSTLFLTGAKTSVHRQNLKPHDIDLTQYNMNSRNVVFGITDKFQNTQQTFMNSPLVPFSVQCVDVLRSDYDQMMKQRKVGKCGLVNYDQSGNELIRVPVRFTIGDGMTWAVSFRLGLDEDRTLVDRGDERRFFYSRSSLPEDVKLLWSSLPTLYAHDAEKQINLLKQFLVDYYDVEIDFKVIDLETLAIATGCRMDTVNHCSLSVIINGHSMLIGVYNLDGGYAKPLSVADPVYSTCLVSELKHSYTAYTVLMGLMLRNTFPDPDCVLSACNMTQSAFIYWFCNFVATALEDAKIGTDSYYYKTRSEMILGLNPESEMIKLLAELVICVPVSQLGGERFLHHARLNFRGQYLILQDILFPGSGRDHPVQSKVLDTSTLLFKRTCSQKCFGKPVDRPGLLECEEDRDTLYSLDAETADIRTLYAQNGRELIPSLEEWGRLNPYRIVALMKALRCLSEDMLTWWMDRLNAYESLRCILFRTLDSNQFVPILDREIHQRQQNVIKQERETLAKRVLQNQVGRVSHMSQLICHEPSTSRVGVHQQIYENRPGDNHDRNVRASKKRKARRARKMQEWSVHYTRKELKRLKKTGEVIPGAPSSVVAKVSGSRSNADVEHSRPILNGVESNTTRCSSRCLVCPSSLPKDDLRFQLQRGQKPYRPKFQTAQAKKEWKSLTKRSRYM